MFKKRLLSLLTTLVMTTSLVTPVLAAELVGTEIGAYVTDGVITGKPGETVSFKIRLSESGNLKYSTDITVAAKYVLDNTGLHATDITKTVTFNNTNYNSVDVDAEVKIYEDAVFSSSPYSLRLNYDISNSNSGLKDNVEDSLKVAIIADTTAPSIIAPAAVNVEATGLLTAVILGNPIVSDNTTPASGIAVTNDAPLVGFPVGSTTVTWTATDKAGNSSTATQVVTVQDTTAPTVTAPANVTVEATGSLTEVTLGSATATDLVSSSDDLKIANNAPASFEVGETTVTWTATDKAGNSSTATQVVTVKDTTAPKVTAPVDVTVEATRTLTEVTLGSATATDLVSSGDDLKITNNAPASFKVGETTVTWTATDKAGNSSTAEQKVTVTDKTAPKLTLPENITVYATKAEGADVTFSATALDLVDGSVSVSSNYVSGTTFAPGTTTVICTARDSHGNVATETFTVTVKYKFGGLLQPVDTGTNVINTVKAGSAVPVKFSLNGDMGLNVFAAGYPKVIDAKFAGTENYDEIESVIAATNSGLTYDSVTKTYTYVWKTDKTWTGASKQLVIKLKDGTTCTANFLFK
jgi:hypothetical protein